MQKMVMCVVVWMSLAGAAAAEEPLYVNGTSCLVAPTEKVLDHVLSLVEAKDYEALTELIVEKVVITLPEGTKVQVLERRLTSEKIKIRPYGTNFTVWGLARFFEPGNG